MALASSIRMKDKTKDRTILDYLQGTVAVARLSCHRTLTFKDYSLLVTSDGAYCPLRAHPGFRRASEYRNNSAASFILLDFVLNLPYVDIEATVPDPGYDCPLCFMPYETDMPLCFIPPRNSNLPNPLPAYSLQKLCF